MIWIPTGKAINPIANANWEGTGGTPHIETTADDALDVAYLKALKVLSEKCRDEETKQYYNWQINGLNPKVNPVTVNKLVLKSYAGKFGPREVLYDGRRLIYQRQG